MKFWVNSPEHSEEIQRELFRLDYKWYPYRRFKIMHQNSKFLFAYSEVGKSGYLAFSDNDNHFNQHDHTETTLEELKAM